MIGSGKIEDENNIVLFTVIILSLCFLGYIWTHPYPYNTEQVCFNDEGEIAFYAQGFDPSKTPVVGIAPKTFKILATGKKLDAVHCKWRWGVNPPNGREYWEIKVD